MKEIVSGLPGSGDVSAMSAAAASSAPAVFPAFREELVGCLLYVLLSHPRGAAGAAARGGAAPAGASSSVAEASELQALSEAAEWLTSAKTALQVGLGSGRLAGLWGLLRVAWWLVQSGETCQVRHAPPSMPDLAPALPPPSSLTHTSPPGHQGVPGLGPRGGGPHHRHHRRHRPLAAAAAAHHPGGGRRQGAPGRAARRPGGRRRRGWRRRTPGGGGAGDVGAAPGGGLGPGPAGTRGRRAGQDVRLGRCLGALDQRLASMPCAWLAAGAGRTKESRGVPPVIPPSTRNPLNHCLLQGMLLQIAANWRALHPVVRPRAVWVCCYHLHFKSVLDGAWNSCADASECLACTCCACVLWFGGSLPALQPRRPMTASSSQLHRQGARMLRQAPANHPHPPPLCVPSLPHTPASPRPAAGQPQGGGARRLRRRGGRGGAGGAAGRRGRAGAARRGPGGGRGAAGAGGHAVPGAPHLPG